MFRLLLLFCCLYVSCYGQPASLLLSKHTRRLYIITRFFFFLFLFLLYSLLSRLCLKSAFRVLKLERDRKKKRKKKKRFACAGSFQTRLSRYMDGLAEPTYTRAHADTTGMPAMCLHVLFLFPIIQFFSRRMISSFSSSSSFIFFCFSSSSAFFFPIFVVLSFCFVSILNEENERENNKTWFSLLAGATTLSTFPCLFLLFSLLWLVGVCLLGYGGVSVCRCVRTE